MSDEHSQATTKNKRYYWLKLQEYFFNQDEFLQLEDNYDAILGQCCAYFYIKLCSCATENGVISKVVGSKIIPYNEKSLSKLTNTPIKVIKFSLEVLLELGLINYDSHGAIILPHINEMVGSETESTRRSRKSRMLQCNDDATLVQHQRNHILDIEEDEDKKKDVNTDKKESKSKKINPRDYIKLFEQNQWFDLFRGFRNKKAIRKWLTYLEQRGSSLKAITPVSWESSINKMVTYCKTYDLLDAVEIAVESNWDGLSLGRDYSVKTEKRSLISQAISARKMLHERFAEDRYKQSPNMTFEQFLEKKKLNKEDPSVEKLLERMRAGNHHDIIGEETPESVEQKNV